MFRVILADQTLWMLKIARLDRALDDRWDPDKGPQAGLETESAALEALASALGPRPFRLLSTHPPAALMGFVPGDTPRSLYAREAIDDHALLRIAYRIGETSASVHAIGRPDAPGAIPDVPFSDPDTAVLLHGALHLGNVQVVLGWRQRWQINGVLDWMRARWGPREADLVPLHLELFREHRGTREAFLAGYMAAGGPILSREGEQIYLHAELERRLEGGLVADAQRDDWERWERELRDLV